MKATKTESNKVFQAVKGEVQQLEHWKGDVTLTFHFSLDVP
jgi:hypothetical protein